MKKQPFFIITHIANFSTTFFPDAWQAVRTKVPALASDAIPLVVLATVYYFMAWFGLQILPISGFATFIWPATGVALAALVVFGTRLWPSIAIGAFLANTVHGASIPVALGIAAGNTLEAYLGATLLKRYNFRDNFQRLWDVQIFVVYGALLATTISATIGVTSLWLGGVVKDTISYGATWGAWWVGDLFGAIVVAPLLLTWRTRAMSGEFTKREVLEATALGLVVGVLLALSLYFGAIHYAANETLSLESLLATLPLAFFLIVPLIWAALRFGSRGTTTIIALATVAWTVGARMNLGPFGGGSPASNFLSLDLFVIVTSAVALVLAAAVAEHRTSRTSLEVERRDLEKFLEDAVVGIRRIAPDGRILWANRAALDVLGFEAEEYVGHNIAEFHLDAGALVDIMTRLRQQEPVINYETEMRHKDGTSRFVRISASAMEGPDHTIEYRSFMTDITEQKRREEKMLLLANVNQILLEGQTPHKRLQSLAELIVNSMADWCVVDLVREQEIMREVKVSKEEDRALTEDVTSDVYKKQLRALKEVVRSGRSKLLTSATPSADGEATAPVTQPWSLLIVPMRTNDKIVGAITLADLDRDRHYSLDDLAFAEDLAHRAAISLENVELVWKLRLSQRAKDDFLAELSHELRNPLAAIMTATEVIRSNMNISRPMSYPLKVLVHQVRQLAHLLDDLLDVSMIGRDKVILQKKRIDLRTIIHHAMDTVQPFINDRHHTLTVALPDKAVWLNADPVRIEQVIVNLLQNAIKYTKPGGLITLTCERQRRRAIIRVKDNGRGIPSDALKKIFQPFWKTGSFAKDFPTSGMGLGLSLVKTFVDLHGGDVTAMSAGPGNGSEFVVTLPISTNPVKTSSTKASIHASRLHHARQVH